MKRKLLMTLLALTLALCSILGLTACGGNNDNGNNSGGGNSTISVTSITLNRSSLNLEIGDTVSLYETIYPSNATDKSVTWRSSNTSVATVSNGTVTAKSSGTATITVKTSNNKTATCYVTVNNSAPQTVAVSSVSLNKTSATLEVGDTLSLYATINPSNATDKNVTWSSSNTSVATVSNGYVVAKSSGIASITVKTSNNKTATCYVTVNSPVVAVSSISFNKTNEIVVQGDSFDIKTTISPSDATDKSITWSSSNSLVATVSNGTIIAKSSGVATITAKTRNNKTAACSVRVVKDNFNFSYDSYSCTYSITSYNGTDTTVYFPSIYNGKSVNCIYGMEENNIITNVVIPDSVTSIGIRAFANCTNLTSVEMPESARYIFSSTFEYCSKLSNITIPEGVKDIGWSMFLGCETLTSIIIPESVTSISGYAFAGCNSLTDIIIPSGVTSIENSAFRGCDSLASINVSESNSKYKSIDGNLYSKDGKTLFQYTVGKTATSFKIPNGVTSISEYAFENSDSLTAITIPKSVSIIERDVFSGCEFLTIYCEANNKVSGWADMWNQWSDSWECCPVVWNCVNNDIADDGYIYAEIDGIRYKLKDNYAIVTKQKTTLKKANIFSNVIYKNQEYVITSIESSAFRDTAFYNNEKNWENGVLYAGKHLIEANANLSGDYIIKDGTRGIADYAFYNCSNLISITISDGLMYIGECSIYWCSNLLKIVIPSSVTSIQREAISYCTAATIYCEAKTSPNGWESYWNYNNRPVIWDYKNNSSGEGADNFGVVFNTPICPQQFNYWSYVKYGNQYVKEKFYTANITKISCELVQYYSRFKLVIKVEGTKTWAFTNGSYIFSMDYKVKDNNNYVIESGTLRTKACAVGDSFIIIKEISIDDLSVYGNTWTIELSDYISTDLV